MNISKEFGRLVRQQRELKGWSQDELAHRADLHRTYIGSVERGERNITLESAYRISQALQLQLKDIIPSENERNT